MEGARIRKDALAAIEELKAKGPGYKREVSLWGKVGAGALAVGCPSSAGRGSPLTNTEVVQRPSLQ